MSYDFNASFFVVLGLTGAGKSCFINAISDTNCCKVDASGKSCTQMNEMVSFVYNNHRYNALDTPGLDDSDNNDEKIKTVKQILNKHKDVKTLIYVKKYNELRVPLSLQEAFKVFMEAFPLRDFWEHIIIVNTWANPNDESFKDYIKEQHETFLEKILQCENLKKIMESKKIDVPHSLKEYFVCSKKKSKYPEISKIFDEIKIDIKSKKFMFKDIQIGPIIKDIIKSKKNAGFYTIKEYRIITCVDFDNNKSTIEQIIHQDEIPPENFKLVRVNREEVFEDSDDVKWYDVATLGIARIIRKTKRYKVFKTKVYKIGDKEIIGDRLEDGYIYK